MPPGLRELALDLGHAVLAALRAQALRQAEQRPAVAGIPAQLLAVDRLGLARPPRGQQHGAQRVAHRCVPAGRFVVGDPILDGYGLAQRADGRGVLAARGGDLGGSEVRRSDRMVSGSSGR